MAYGYYRYHQENVHSFWSDYMLYYLLFENLYSWGISENISLELL